MLAWEVQMSKRKRRSFTKEQKADAVNLARTSDQSIAQVARNLGLHENSLRRWVEQAQIYENNGSDGSLTTMEKAEIRQLKRDITRLKMENEFLKKLRPTSRRRPGIRSNPFGAGQLSGFFDVPDYGCFEKRVLCLENQSVKQAKT